MSSNSNRNRIHPYVIVGSLTALGGVALGVASSWIFNKFTKKRRAVTCPTTHHVQILSNYDESDENENITVTRTDGVYIQEDEHTQFLTNDEFQRYFEYNINKDDGVELDWCLLEYALKLDPMNLHFLKNEQKTFAFEKLAVEQNIEAIVYCRSEEDIYDLELPNEPITYKKYEIHDYAYELYGNEIYRFIDHPEGYSYDELMSMPPPEYKDMTVSEVFNTIQQVEVKNMPSKEGIINSIIEENTPDILKIEFTADLTSDEEEDNDTN
jgi:hypothetical protein